jgi:NADH-quinone oxidoreductase subunit J
VGLLGYVLVEGFSDTELPMSRVGRTGEVGDVLFGSFVVPFLAVSVLLLAALVGAIVLARRD